MPGAGEGDVGQGVGVKGGVALLDDEERESTTQSHSVPLSPRRLNQMTSFSEAKDRSRWIKLPTQENEDVYSFCYFYKNR